MTEGPWTLGAPLCVPDLDVEAAYRSLARAIQRMGAAVRMSQTECVRADVHRSSHEACVIAWQNVNEVLEEATMAAEGSLATLLEVTLQTPASSRTQEE